MKEHGINLLFPGVYVSQANVHNVLGRYAGSQPGEPRYVWELETMVFPLR